MEPGLNDRVSRLEARLDLLQRELDEERAAIARRRRYESRLRIALLVALAVFYALYFHGIQGL